MKNLIKRYNFKFEELCQHSEKTLGKIFQHAHLNNAAELITNYENRLTLPKYYQLAFNQQEINTILEITQAVSEIFGYNVNNFN
jgi:hypothetical protein